MLLGKGPWRHSGSLAKGAANSSSGLKVRMSRPESLVSLRGRQAFRGGLRVDGLRLDLHSGKRISIFEISSTCSSEDDPKGSNMAL